MWLASRCYVLEEIYYVDPNGHERLQNEISSWLDVGWLGYYMYSSALVLARELLDESQMLHQALPI